MSPISLLGSSVVIAAEPIKEKGSLETLIERITEKYNERIETRTEFYNERVEKATTRSDRMLEIINTVNPDLVDGFTVLQQEHSFIHEEIFNLNISLRAASYDQFIIELTEYYNQLLAKVSKKEITPLEMRESIRTFLEEKRSEMIASIEAYKEAIADAKADNELVIKQIKANGLALREALDSHDLIAANDALTNIMSLVAEHIAYDSYKLNMLQNFPF